MTIPGGLPPMRPDQALQALSRAGVGPAPQNAFIRARIVVISGPADGLFVYAGTPTTGNLIGGFSSVAGVDAFGNAYPAGLFADEGVLTGISYQGTMLSLDPGPFLLYGNPGTVVQYLTGSGNWVAPAGVTSVFAEAWGSGQAGTAGAFITQGGPGGIGGEYAAEPALVVHGGGSYPYSVGTAGADTTFAGDAVTVTAHGGTNSGTGSTNTTHFNGGRGGLGANPGGGGAGGGGAGPSSAGNTGAAGTLAAGGAETPPVSGGGAGGAGAIGANATAGQAPAGAGGGTDAPFTPGPGGAGQLRVTYTASGVTVLLASLAAAAGTDPATGDTYLGGLTLDKAWFVLFPSGDTSGAKDLTAIDAAVDTGGKAQLDGGPFYASTSILPAASGTTLEGTGINSTVIHALSAAAHGLFTSGLSNVAIRNLTLDGPGDVAGAFDGVHLDETGGAISNQELTNVKILNFGNYGFYANNIITSSLRNVEAQLCAEDGFVILDGTSVAFEACYANNVSGFGYFINGMSYCGLVGCASDFGQWGYFIEGSNNIGLLGCGCESQSIGGFNLNGGINPVLVACENFKNPGIGFLVTADCEGAVLIGCQERTPAGGATASFQVDAGSSASFIQPVYVTAPSFPVSDDPVFSVRPDGTVYNTGRLSGASTVSQTLLTTAAVPLASLSGFAVNPGTYRVEAKLTCQQLTAAVTQRLGWQGGFTSGSRLAVKSYPITQPTQIYPDQVVANTTVTVPAFVLANPFVIEISGVVVFTAADTFGLTGWQGTAGDQWEVLAGSFIDLMPVSTI